jgi:hypothetical protein
VELADNINRNILLGISSGYKVHCKIIIQLVVPDFFFVMTVLFHFDNLGQEE